MWMQNNYFPASDSTYDLGAERNDRFVRLDDAAQRFPFRINHGAAQRARARSPSSTIAASGRVGRLSCVASPRRVLRFGEVRSLSLDPARATAALSYRLADGDADGSVDALFQCA